MESNESEETALRTPLMEAAATGALEALQKLLAAGDADVNVQDEKGDTALHAACAHGDVSVVRWLVGAGARVDAMNEDGDSVLHAAAAGGHVEVIEYLVKEAGVEVDVRNTILRTPLHHAAREGRIDAVKELLKHGAELDAQDEEEGTALFRAALNGRREVVQYLLDQGADVNAVETDGWQPIHGAAQSGDVETIELLLERGAVLTSLTEDGRSVLHVAAVTGALNAVKFFVKRELEVDATNDDEQTALYLAATKGRRAVIEYLLDSGADVNAVETDGWLPIHAAAQSGDTETIELLIERGADLHTLTEDGRTVLHVAAENGSVDAIKLFVGKELDVDATNNNDQRPLFLAAWNGHREAVEYLLDAGADVHAVDNNGWACIHIAVRSDDIEVIERLVERGADPKQLTESGWTALHAAADEGNCDAVRFFLRSGVEVDATETDDQTALFRAAVNGHREIVETLLDAGADVNAVETDGWQPIHGAAQSGDVEMIELLLQRGADLQSLTEDGRTVLHVAAENGSVDAIKLFITRELEVDATTNDDQTALFQAAINGHRKIVETLLDAGADVNAVETDGWQPIHGAAQSGDVEMIELLLQRGADLQSLTEDERSVLHVAAANGAVDAVRFFVRNGMEVDATNDDGQTALFFAAVNGSHDVMEYLLDAGADVNAADVNDFRPIHNAARSDDVQAAVLLLERGADLHSLTENGHSALHEATKHGDLEMVKFFVHSGLEVDAATNTDWDPLYLATINRHRELVEFLLDQGADIDAVGHLGFTPLHLAVMSGEMDMIQLLLDRGADKHAAADDGHNVLHMAAAEESEGEIVELFLSLGFNIEATDNTERTALHYAALKGNPKNVECLLKHGANPNATEEKGSTPLHYAAQTGDIDSIDCLLKHGADVHRMAENGSALHVAAGHRHADAVKLFVEAGVDVEARDTRGRTVLYFAAMGRCHEAMEYLLDRGASVNALSNGGRYPVHVAARHGDAKMIELLLQRGADVHVQDKAGRSVLHDAADSGEVEAVEILIRSGVNVHAVNNDDQTALFSAGLNGHDEIVRVLLDAGADVNAAEVDGWLPIHGAAQSGDVDTIQLLVQHGANIHGLTKDNRSVLHVAAASGSEEAVKFLLGLGLKVAADNFNQPDQGGLLPIHHAAREGDLKTLKVLAEIGADIHSVTTTGQSALFVAANNGNEEIITYLLENGAKVDQVDENGWTALHAAARQGSSSTVDLLIQAGADVNAKDNDGETVLHVAVAAANIAASLMLMRRGADVSVIDESNGWSTLLYAASGGSVQLLRHLIKKGEDIHAVAQDGKTAFHVACAEGRLGAAEFLMKKGVDVNAVDKEGRTALHCASEAVGSGSIAFLLRASTKALVDVPDQAGNQPLHLAAQKHHLQEVRQLLEAGADIHALTTAGESPLQLAVFAERTTSAASTISLLCRFGAEWTTKCEEKLDQMKVDIEDSATEDSSQHLSWCLGLRACVLHWEKQRQERATEFIKVPIEVIERGATSVKTYLADATSSNADELTYRCKVCVVGPSEWGKSSLVRSIETMKPFLMDIRDRTIGIELVPSSLSGTTSARRGETDRDETAPSPGNTDSSELDTRPRRHEVTFWDFAGQDVYQVAHSLFFSRRTLYVLVVDVHAYAKQLDKIKHLRSSEFEAAMGRFLSRQVFRWVRTIFARQPDAEFVVLGTKADLLENEAKDCARVWSDLQSRVYQWKLNYMREIEEEYGIVTEASRKVKGGNTGHADTRTNIRVRELAEKLARLASEKWLVVSVTRHDSIEAVRQALQRTIETSERGFPMWNKYSRVLQAISAKREAANRPGDGQHRIEHGMMLFRPLCRQLMDEIEDLEYDECRDILRTLHDLGDIIWYENDESGELRDFIILDPMLVIDIVREVISHEHTKKSGAVPGSNQGESEEQPRIDGRVSHELLETFPLWRHMDKELVYAFKMLLKQFQLVYPADDEVMDPESDLIVPCYWKAQFEAASASTAVPSLPADTVSRSNYHCWEYEVSADLADAIFEQFAVQSYTSFMKREVRANCIESSCAEFDSWITLHPGKTRHDVIRVEVASENADISWLNMRYYLMKLEKVLDGYSGLAVPRYVVVGDNRHSIAPAAKAVRDTIMMGRDVKSLRVQMPWLPPDLDWLINRAWRDIASFKELQMMHLVRDKLEVLQKLVIKGDSQRRYPALWSLEYVAAKRVAVLRMLSDLSGRCYHVPIEIEVPPAFLAQHGSRIKDGISLLSNILPSSLSVPILQTAIDGVVSCLEAKTQQAANVHNLIERFDLTTGAGDVIKSSTDSGLSPGGTMAILRDLLKLHNDSLDELSITEICNLECAATSKGDYVWAHIHEINMLKNELTPCQPRYEGSTESSTPSAFEPVQEPVTPERPLSSSKIRASKLRLSLCIETVAGLPDWDWYKTYCKWQLLYGDQMTVLASGATTHNADSTTQPSWPLLKMPLDPVDSVEMLKVCRLVVRVKRHSRIGWTKLIGEGEVKLHTVLPGDAEADFRCDRISVMLLASGSVATQRVVTCTITSSA